jgi:branched-chain amino acid transport system permease protein
MRWKGYPISRKKVLVFFGIFIIIFLPLYPSRYLVTLMIMAMLYAYLTQSWNIMGGYTGQLSLGDAAYFGIGGYFSGMLALAYGLPGWAGLFVGGFVGMVFGLFIGFISFRFKLRGIYFAVATLAITEMGALVGSSLEFVGGAMGKAIPFEQNPVKMQFLDELPYYYIIFCMLCLITYLVHRLENSKIGYYLIAIREREETAESIGVNLTKYKLLAVGTSAFLTGAGGAFYALYSHYIIPHFYFSMDIVIKMLLGTFLGGKGTVLGPILGSFVLSFIAEGIQAIPIATAASAALSRILYAGIIISIVIFLPNGIISRLERKYP